MEQKNPPPIKSLSGSPFELRLHGSATDEQAEAEAAVGEFGYLHSYTTGSAVDGPGIRTVLWTTGCHFRCQYCHNPDTWHLKNGARVSAAEVLAEVARYQGFMRAGRGGVTISGGEPLVQAPFVLRILRGCQQRGIHTALDTNGYLGDVLRDEDLDAADLYLLDIKSWDVATHLRATGKDVGDVLRFARRLAEHRRPMWLRFVLVPGLTDERANIEGLADFAATLGNVERVEVLPFHQMGRSKWQRLGLRYTLDATQPPSAEATQQAQQIFRERGLMAV
ncbi:pyruvate formate lyase-activating protein [Chloroflexia bacterium SDU3-3]|nr:pyruvate formate lyase-activating protein [Chloroflexia bacterium SDU3-3]